MDKKVASKGHRRLERTKDETNKYISNTKQKHKKNAEERKKGQPHNTPRVTKISPSAGYAIKAVV